MRLLLSLLTLTTSLTSQTSDLSETETRVVGGTVVQPAHKYPFQVTKLMTRQMTATRLLCHIRCISLRVSLCVAGVFSILSTS